MGHSALHRHVFKRSSCPNSLQSRRIGATQRAAVEALQRRFRRAVIMVDTVVLRDMDAGVGPVIRVVAGRALCRDDLT